MRMLRSRLARVVLVVAILVVAGQLLEALPREVEIRYVLGPDHGSVTEARIAYLQDGHEMKGVSFRYDQGAPRTLRHTVELPPGRYEIVVDLRGPDVKRSHRRGLRVPADGVVHIDLGPRHAHAVLTPRPWMPFGEAF